MDTNKKILIVDDIEVNRIILQEILSDGYEVECAEDGLEAISLLINSVTKPNLVLLDIMMPVVDGFEVIRFMKEDPSLSSIPVIFITAADQEMEGLRAGAADYISKPFEPQLVQLRVATQIELDLYRKKLEAKVAQKTAELLITKENFLHTIANLIEYRNMDSGHHVRRTRDLAQILAGQMLQGRVYSEELKEQDLHILLDAVPLHDIGKIGIIDSILLKPGRLTADEFEAIKRHVTLGADVILSLKMPAVDQYLQHCYDICRHHHERWDGSGYPDGLAGEEIPLSARMVAVVDVYDALISERCYKAPIPHDDAVEIIKQGSGSQFDPRIVEAFLMAEEEFKAYAAK